MLSRSAYFRRCEISDLPHEILPQIFKYLSTNERKTVKLVCLSWLKACNDPLLLDQELITCLGIYQLSDTYELLNRSLLRFLSLKFESVKFTNPSSFWESNGYKVRSIDFRNCIFFDGTLEKIISYCVNLIHLSFTYTASFAEKYTSSESPINENDLDKVLKIGIIRENLKSLRIEVYDADRFKISNYTIHQLFSIFPKVKILEMKHVERWLQFRRRGIDLDLSLQFSNKDRFTFSPVLNYLKAATDRIEKLQLDFPCARFPLHILHPTFTAMKSLTELSINMGESPLPEDINVLILCSKQLQSLELIITFGEERLSYYSSSFHRLLSNSSLTYLKIQLNRLPLVVSKAFFEKLMSSRLKNLNLSARSIAVDNPDSSVPLLLAKNKPIALPNLSLQVLDSEEGSLSLFLQNFQHLHHLELHNITESMLESLFKFKLPKLKSLNIGSGQRTVAEDRFDIYKNAFNQLTSIEYLDLTFPVTSIFIRCLSPERILANLKYLRIHILLENMREFTSDFLKAADAMPFLEALKIYNFHDVSFDFCVKLCSKLNRLRYFYYNGFWFVEGRLCGDGCYPELFSVCPSLRALVHCAARRSKTYFFDTINKEVLLKQTDDEISFSRPKVGDSSIWWLVLP